NQWNDVEVSYADHITNDEVPIRQGARYSGIHVFEQTTDPGDFQFTNPLQTMINANLSPNSMKGTCQRITAKRPQKEQTKVLSSPILSSSQLRPPAAKAKKGPGPKPILPVKRSLEDVIGETSERFLEEEVYPTTIPNDPPFIRSCGEGGDDIELEAVSAFERESEESCSKTESEGSDSDDPFDCVGRRLGISAKVNISSGDASLGSIREAINSLELLMVKDLSEVSSDPNTQSKLHQQLDLLCKISHPKVTVEVK
ncbi:putative disease resistance protein (TIR-NBS-LRR class), partial [Trifolium medium]|nr:putative disease resistance protein (TIR-NBS-LRR class) [Trifolium medium]